MYYKLCRDEELVMFAVTWRPGKPAVSWLLLLLLLLVMISICSAE
jgi:hypothetical protein